MCYMTIHECLSFGVHLSMCFTVRKERAYIPRCTTPELFFHVVWVCSWTCADSTPLFGLQTLSKNHPLATHQNIAGSLARRGEATKAMSWMQHCDPPECSPENGAPLGLGDHRSIFSEGYAAGLYLTLYGTTIGFCGKIFDQRGSLSWALARLPRRTIIQSVRVCVRMCVRACVRARARMCICVWRCAVQFKVQRASRLFLLPLDQFAE